ncbi:chitobiase/beta-hexosaminidase C-terminal domain-containing protein, partial [Pseudomonadales bacterium]|nr:chitobiase/beta-hexosaminidase C-terminal domain-containing protein [Pseudomonadales bacterium]
MISRRLECHRLLKIFVRVWLLGVLALSATSAFAAQRQIDSSSCSPSVSIAVTPPSEVASWAFEEAIGRLTPSNINRNGVWIQAEGVIRWGADLEPLSTTLTYDLAGPDGSYRISGDESVDGRSSLVDEDQVVLSCEAESLPETVTTPLISEPTGTRVPLDLTVSVSTPGATLHYTLDGAVPTSADAVYSGPISLTQATYVKVIAVKQGMRSSEVASAYYAGPERILSQTLLQTISNEVCEPQITINVTPLDSVESYGVVMPMPLGTRPTSISDEGVWDAATSELKWGGFKDSQARSFSFKLAGPDGVYSLQGQASFDGYDRQIGGDIRFEQDCIPPMAAPPVFDPPRGRVPVTVGITSATDGAVIRFTLDGSDPSVNSALYESPIQIDSPLTLTARAFKAGLEPSESRKADYLTGSRPKAIIVAGGGPYTGNALWPATLKVSQYAYNALMYQGYSKDDIWLISPVDDVDFDGNGELDDVDADASAANLEYAITEWAQNASDLIVYLTDHGGYGEFVINNLGVSPDLVNVGQLDTWFDDLQSESSARITLIYDACQSGTFVEGLLPPSGSDRIVLTSASNQPALFLEGGVLSFSYQFWAAVFYKGKFYDAFLAARDQMQSEQRPLLDANGNGIANEKADRALVQNIVIGRGAVAASVPPELQAVSPPQTLNGETSAVIEVGSITALNPITRVWAVMVPPNF